VEVVNLHDVIEDSLRTLQNQHRFRAVTVHRDYADGLPAIRGHVAHLGQCFINIIKNAIEAMPENGGVLTLVTKRSDRREGIVFECRDNGKGIAEDRIKDIFKPFYTTKEAGKGTGLGLYISHEIVKKHGGRIDVVSEGNRGSVFKVELPLSPQHSDPE